PDLLRARILRRHRAELRARDRRLDRVTRGCQQLRNAEVEESRLAIRRHQNVPRLDVAMDDQVLMRVVHRAADGAEETKARADPELVPIAVGGDRHAVDVLHDEKWKLAVRDAAVEKLRDATVPERSEDLSFGHEATMQVLGVGVRVEQLHRNALLVLSVVSL